MKKSISRLLLCLLATSPTALADDPLLLHKHRLFKGHQSAPRRIAPLPGYYEDSTACKDGTQVQTTPEPQPDTSADANQPSTSEPTNSAVDNNAVSESDLRNMFASSRPASGDLLSSTGGLARVGLIGDFFAPAAQFVTGPGINTAPLAISPGSQIGTIKLADQNSPIPRDRIFFNYSYFRNANLTADGADMNAFTPGFEKTFFDRQVSFELRTPMATTLNSQTVLNSPDGFQTSKYEFGNMILAVKAILASDDQNWLTGGLGFRLPTANTSRLIQADTDGNIERLAVQNQSVHLLPYIATLHQRGDWVWMNYAQIDIAANGNPVFGRIQPFSSNFATFEQIGVYNDQNYLLLDTSLSRWCFRDDRTQRGFAITGELHYNKTVTAADVINNSGYILGNQGFQADIINGTIGSQLLIGQTVFTTAYVTPFTPDRGFDGEFRILINRFF